MNNVFNDLISLKEAADTWHLEQSTIRKAIAADKFIVGVDVKKFGKQWVIDKKAMSRVYGYLNNETSENEDISAMKKRQIYYFINECFIGYTKKYSIDIKNARKEFIKYNIIDYLYECYDYLHLQNTNKTIVDISSRIRRGINYV